MGRPLAKLPSNVDKDGVKLLACGKCKCATTDRSDLNKHRELCKKYMDKIISS